MSLQKKKRRSTVPDGRQFAGMRWEFSYDYKENGCIAAADTLGDWYKAKIIDVITPEDEHRWNKVTEQAIIVQRGLNGVRPVKAKRDIRFDNIINGNWLRIHFQGWGSNSDEWILFQVRGFICLAGEEGKEGEKAKPARQCFCERHFDEVKYKEYLSTVARGAPAAASLAPQEELLQPCVKLSQPVSTEYEEEQARGGIEFLLNRSLEMEAAAAATEKPENPPVVASNPPPVINEPQEGQTSQLLAKHQDVLLHQLLLEESQGFVLNKSTKTQQEENKQPVAVDPALLLEVNPDTGRPLLAERMLQQAERDCMSIERLLRDHVGLNQNVLAGRRWLKGEKLARPSVLLAASHIAEWFLAKQEGRAAAPVCLDMAQIDAYVKLRPVPQPQSASSDRYKRFPAPSPVTLKRKALKPAAIAVQQPSKRKQVVMEEEEEEEEEDVFEEEETVVVAIQEPPPAAKPQQQQPEVTSDKFNQHIKLKLCNVQSSSEGRAYVAGVITFTDSSVTRWYGLFPTQTIAEQAEKRAKANVERCFAELQRTTASASCSVCGSGNAQSVCKECENDLFMAAVDSCGSFSKPPTVAPTPLLPASQTNYYNPKLGSAPPSSTSSTTQWRGSAFPTAPNRLAEQRTYFTKFAFRPQDTRSQYGEFSILDHIILSRRCMHDEIPEEEEQNTPDYFVGQIEALWEEHNPTTGQVHRFVRVNWFFWPEEADTQMQSYAEVGNGQEVFTSSEVDNEPLYRVLAKTRVLCAADFKKIEGKPEEAGVVEVKLDWDAAPASPPPAVVSKSPVVEETAPQPQPRRKHKSGNAPTVQVGDIQMRGCKRCGMWGFTSPSELSAHTARFCGADNVEALQRRRSEAGRPVLIGIHAPAEPTIVCERVQYPQQQAAIVASPPRAAKRQKRVATVTSAADDEELFKNEYVNPQIVRRALKRANQGPFFAQNHFSLRKSQVTTIQEQDGNNELQSSLLFGVEDPYWTQKMDQIPQFSCLHSLFASSAPSAVEKCTFCYKQLFPETDVRFTCEVCENVHLCLACMRRGRQGAGGHQHSHPYHVSLSTLDQTRPQNAQHLLQRKLPEGTTVEYSLLEITRLPLGRPRFRYGATIAGKTSLCADEFAYTIEDAKNQCAITCLRVFFGAATVYSFPVLSFEWTAWEAAKLLDMLRMHGLAWETVAPLMGTKTAAECREFFSQHFLHNKRSAVGAAAAAPTVQISLVSREGQEELQDLDFQPESVAKQDAKEFVARVDEFYLRRVGGRRNLLGIVNGNIYSVPPPVVSDKRMCCDKPDDGSPVVACLTCLEKFHVNCLPEQDRDAQVRAGAKEWYCQPCLQDERYLFEHYCWGDAGRVVCGDIAEGGEQAVARWKANAECIKQITAGLDAAAGKKATLPVAMKPACKGKRASAAAAAQEQEQEEVELTDPFYVACKESIESLRLALAKVREERDNLLKEK